MEYLEKFFKKSGWLSILESIIFAVLGIIVLNNSVTTMKVIESIIGIIFIVVGTCKIINWIIARGKYNLYNYDLFYGLLAVTIGIIAIMYTGAIESIFRIIIGIWMIYMSLTRINFSFYAKKSNIKIWIYTFILAILTFICGIYIISNVGALMEVIGTLMIVYSIIDIIENIIFIKNIKEIF